MNEKNHIQNPWKIVLNPQPVLLFVFAKEVWSKLVLLNHNSLRVTGGLIFMFSFWVKFAYLEIKEKEKHDKKHSFNKEIYILHFSILYLNCFISEKKYVQ